MNIIITVKLEAGTWSNGLNQNCIFLADLLSNIGHDVALMATGSTDSHLINSDYPVFNITDLDHLTGIDYFLQAAFVCPDKWVV